MALFIVTDVRISDQIFTIFRRANNINGAIRLIDLGVSTTDSDYSHMVRKLSDDKQHNKVIWVQQASAKA
jgi:hypothetical protein